jgi:hypothetical protein
LLPGERPGIAVEVAARPEAATHLLVDHCRNAEYWVDCMDFWVQAWLTRMLRVTVKITPIAQPDTLVICSGKNPDCLSADRHWW